MNFYIKNKCPTTAEAWIEDFCPKEIDWIVVCNSELIIAGNKCLIDTIETNLKYRRKGYATMLINELQSRFDEVEPIGIVPESRGFWDKLDMEDGLGGDL